MLLLRSIGRWTLVKAVPEFSPPRCDGSSGITRRLLADRCRAQGAPEHRRARVHARWKGHPHGHFAEKIPPSQIVPHRRTTQLHRQYSLFARWLRLCDCECPRCTVPRGRPGGHEGIHVHVLELGWRHLRGIECQRGLVLVCERSHGRVPLRASGLGGLNAFAQRPPAVSFSLNQTTLFVSKFLNFFQFRSILCRSREIISQFLSISLNFSQFLSISLNIPQWS